MIKKISLFVPGRLCFLGEHSDWASSYKSVNKNIENGYAIAFGIEEGIYASAEQFDRLVVEFKDDSSKRFECAMDYDNLEKVAKEGGYWSYIAGVAAILKKQFDVSGIKLTIDKVTIPEKKGLSSSASICVLTTRAFNQLYRLNLDVKSEINIAYLGERLTPSKCGKLDQVCAFGKKGILLEFDENNTFYSKLEVGSDLHFVFADLKGKKDTIKILLDLNSCYPIPNNKIADKVHEALGRLNKKNIEKAIRLIKDGKVKELGMLMSEVQELFDEYVAPACLSELTSPILHKTLNDEFLKKHTLGGKGVGSQGDGTVQFLVENRKEQEIVKKYLNDELQMDAYSLTIPKTQKIKKAIIPVAGNGTRMYPITKALKKAFLPIIDSDGIVKPAILSLIEELDESGIDEICLIIDKGDDLVYDAFFKNRSEDSITKKISEEMRRYDEKINRIGKKIRYIVQEEKLGLGHAVSLCEDFADGEDILLVLGDQLFHTDDVNSCTKQLLEIYYKVGGMVLSACEVKVEDVTKYGILTGVMCDNGNTFNVTKMTEKPSVNFAETELFTEVNGEKKFFSVFGEYILPPEVFKRLKYNIQNGILDRGEYQLTSVLDEIRQMDGMTAFVPNGEMLDIGNVNSYGKTFVKKFQSSKKEE